MEKHAFNRLYAYMLAKSDEKDPVHNHQHIDRVLHYALKILATEPGANQEVVITAVLLHDIARKEERQNPALKHAPLGAKMAESFLVKEGYSPVFARQVAQCIATHSYKKGKPAPDTLEAKILYDGDKLDLTGTVGVIRAALFGSQIGEPLYHLEEIGAAPLTRQELPKSLIGEYRQKLAAFSQGFLTSEGRNLAAKQQKTMDSFFTNLVEELTTNYRQGRAYLEEFLE